MGVTVTVTPPSDGRAGQMLHFIVGGKLRRQMYLPPHQRQEIEDEVRSGPSAVDDIDYLGRWKDDGHGGCYWDPNDDGPDQCEPSGGGMVCYHEGQPSECSTEEEEAEFVALIAASEAEVEGYEEDYYDADDALDQYCSQNPWDCQQPAPLANLGGPSACNDPTLSFARCTSEAFEATGAFASHVAAIAGAEGALADAVAAGTRLSTATRLSWAGVLATTAFGAGYFVGSFVNCVFNVVVVPEAELLSLIQPSEPRAGQEFGSASIHAGLNGVMASGRP